MEQIKQNKLLTYMVSALFSLMLVISLAACGNTATVEEPKTEPAQSQEQTKAEEEKDEKRDEKQATAAKGDTRTIKDSEGKEVEVPAQVDKAAPTIGAFAHITSMLGAQDKVVASVTKLSDIYHKVFPKANPNNTDVKNVEEVIASGAQVVYGPNVSDEQQAQYDAAGITTVKINAFSNAEELKSTISLIAEILGGDAPE